MHHRICLLALAAALSACRPARTEVVVVVHSDLAVPSELDQIVIELIGPRGELRRAAGDIASPMSMPASLGIEDRGSGGTVQVTVTGLRRGSNVVQRRARFAFIRGETRVARIDLLRGCIGVGCSVDQTCGDKGCRELDLATDELVPYHPDLLNGSDGGVDGGGRACVSAVEQCNQYDDDCDGRTDEDFDLQSDMRHCGECDIACPTVPDNGSSACEAGRCLLRCDRGYADCDGEVENGCETATTTTSDCGRCDAACGSDAPFCEEGDSGPICVSTCGPGTTDCSGACVSTSSDPMHCGRCDNRCPAPANAVATCTPAGCDYECDDGFFDCDGRGDNGCESAVRDNVNCGSCGRACSLAGAVASCASGTCTLAACNSLRGDCDGNLDNGCERDLRTDVDRCGDCNNRCAAAPANASSTCLKGRCALVCAAGYGNCDGNVDNGCEQPLNTTSHCGGCGIQCASGSPLCAVSGGTFRCTTGCAGAEIQCGTSCVDTSDDPAHCGRCDNPCPGAPNAQPTCTNSSCGRRCLAGYGDCDGNSTNGCEQSLGSVMHCGTCDRACPQPPHTIATCSSGTCGWQCESGWQDCNGQASDGCEVDTRSSAQHCGRCDAPCTAGANVSAVACMNSACRVTACNGSWDDCDGASANGCEIDTAVNRNNCGDCNNACAHNRNCCGGMCRNRGQCP